jgi:thiol-disulfide isomerase/thioredoxin
MLEYEKRRQAYNKWLAVQIENNKAAFVSNTFRFHYVPMIAFKGSEAARRQSAIDHYFDGMDFKDPAITKTTDIKEWMNNYVNAYGLSATTIALRDSLFTTAGKIAIEKARKGHPLVYGWMVDYFYNGYESFNMAAGIKMLETYLADPNCLTTKKQAIAERLSGLETLKPGATAPNFNVTDNSGNATPFSNYKTEGEYKLVLFWSADCSHCKELMKQLYPWYKQYGNKKVDVFALSVDQSEREVQTWKDAIRELQGWKHMRPEGGINSKEAKAYYILSTPLMVLVENKTNKIVALPETVQQLSNAMKL